VRGHQRYRAPGEREHTAPVPADTLSSTSDVEDTLTHEQEVSHLREAIQQLKEQERVVLSLYYFEELKLHEIAKVLELTESRVSQIRSKALSRLRAELTPLRGDTA
jgi:RNA polymerase sigma factor for flagellar operon FliA